MDDNMHPCLERRLKLLAIDMKSFNQFAFAEHCINRVCISKIDSARRPGCLPRSVEGNWCSGFICVPDAGWKIENQCRSDSAVKLDYSFTLWGVCHWAIFSGIKSAVTGRQRKTFHFNCARLRRSVSRLCSASSAFGQHIPQATISSLFVHGFTLGRIFASEVQPRPPREVGVEAKVVVVVPADVLVPEHLVGHLVLETHVNPVPAVVCQEFPEHLIEFLSRPVRRFLRPADVERKRTVVAMNRLTKEQLLSAVVAV
ncbi:MAG: hypothetical protein U0941_30555 [Planctomycetaceae bacterium]